MSWDREKERKAAKNYGQIKSSQQSENSEHDGGANQFPNEYGKRLAVYDFPGIHVYPP